MVKALSTGPTAEMLSTIMAANPPRAHLNRFMKTRLTASGCGVRTRKIFKSGSCGPCTSWMENMHAYGLSSGEAQRLSLVRALVPDPDALFLDEPTASLDPDNTRIIENAISERAQTHGRITVMVTHNLNQATFSSTGARAF